MKIYRNYVIVILILALVLNWVVESNDYISKVDMNLGLLPKKATIAIELLQILLLVRLLLQYPTNNFIMATIVGVAVFCGLELAILKALGANVLIWVAGIRYYFSFLPLLLLGYLFASKGYSIKREFNVLLGLIILQIPVTIYQFMNGYKITLVNKKQLVFDMISGTMGGIASNLMSLVIGIGLLYFMIKFFEEKKPRYFIISFALLIPSALSESKGMLILLLIILMYLALLFKFNLTKILLLGFLAALMVVGFSYLYTLLGYGDLLNVSYLVEYATSESGRGRLSRIDSILYSFELLFHNNTLPLGMGIGNANKNPLGSDGQFFDFFTIRHSIDIFITETGLLGLTFFTICYFHLIRITKDLLKNEAVILDKDNLMIARVFLGTLYFFIYGLLWVDVLYRVQFMYPFGLMAGYILGLHEKLKNDHRVKKIQSYSYKSLYTT